MSVELCNRTGVSLGGLECNGVYECALAFILKDNWENCICKTPFTFSKNRETCFAGVLAFLFLIVLKARIISIFLWKIWETERPSDVPLLIKFIHLLALTLRFPPCLSSECKEYKFSKKRKEANYCNRKVLLALRLVQGVHRPLNWVVQQAPQQTMVHPIGRAISL